MAQMIYADHAATTQLDPDAFQAMLPWMQDEYGNSSQVYSFARKPKKAIEEAKEIIAECIGAHQDEILITSGGTESDNWAIKGSMQYGDHRVTITSEIEHPAILNSCRTIERFGFPVVYVPADKQGIVEPKCLLDLIADQTKLVSIMMANNEIGSIQPIKELCEITHQHGGIFHSDAVQAVGHLKINVKELNVDMLSASAHKFNGPKGIGFLYVKKGTPVSSLMDGGQQELGKRAGTENVPSIVGMSIALKNSCNRIKSVETKLNKLETHLIGALHSSKIEFIQNGSENRIPGSISLSFKNASGEMLLHRLDLMGICVSTGSACDSKDLQLSHVIKAIKVPEEYAYGTIRISLGYENTEQDVQRIADSIIKILCPLR